MKINKFRKLKGDNNALGTIMIAIIVIVVLIVASMMFIVVNEKLKIDSGNSGATKIIYQNNTKVITQTGNGTTPVDPTHTTPVNPDPTHTTTVITNTEWSLTPTLYVEMNNLDSRGDYMPATSIYNGSVAIKAIKSTTQTITDQFAQFFDSLTFTQPQSNALVASFQISGNQPSNYNYTSKVYFTSFTAQVNANSVSFTKVTLPASTVILDTTQPGNYILTCAIGQTQLNDKLGYVIDTIVISFTVIK